MSRFPVSSHVPGPGLGDEAGDLGNTAPPSMSFPSSLYLPTQARLLHDKLWGPLRGWAG